MSPRHAEIGQNQTLPRVIVLEMYYQSIKNYNYLIIDSGSQQAVIVDPAWQMEKIEGALLDADARLSGILITHAHQDHVHLAEMMAEKHECPIWMSKREIETSGFSAGQLIGIDTQPWTVGQMLIEPIFTPGHTPGCMCYLIGDNLFTGDVLFAEGCGICPDAEAAYAMFSSLQHLKVCINRQTRIFPGHSYGKPPGQMLSQLLKDNIYLQFSDKNSFAAFRLRSGQDITKMFTFK
jgi:hydroxyacylglutathione hydrolase